MLPYWLLFGLWLAGTFNFTRSSQTSSSRHAFVVATVLTALMIGLRYQVGGDWEPYLGIYNNIYFQPLIPALGLSDPGYALLNWLAAQADTGIWFVNLSCAILFVGGVGRLASRQPQPWLAMLVAVPYFIIVVAMGYTRQAAAIGIVCFAVADANERTIIRTVILIGVAALFHKTALLMLPLALGPIALRKILTTIVGVILFAALFVLLLRSQSDDLIANYAQSNYDSQGAAVRIAMNVVAGVLFLLFRNRMTLNPYQRSFWTLNALLTFVSVVALVNLSASSGVDRVSLFLIPLQMVALSQLPQALADARKPVLSVLFGVIAYCFAVQFVWLNFADNAVSWLPYNSVLLP
ncbi:EpsG family protein [Sphingomonas sp. CARO-RG-8B-R24-01]|uniref:EpsG family protein n=1 Tax=Sphingomonas sp. CARO-RG-8B-R24-01 TaxID=2914831 RepID=UPI001F568EF9|nr:EpsG family protein [Sphingomonas sp. CARO-RG-8B-R24-01]